MLPFLWKHWLFLSFLFFSSISSFYFIGLLDVHLLNPVDIIIASQLIMGTKTTENP